MKKLSVRFTFIIILTHSLCAMAQVNPVIAGQKAPAELTGHIREIAFQGFTGQHFPKAVLLDFWASWCSPCVATLPKLDSVQLKYQKQLAILSVTEQADDQSEEVLKRIFGKRTLNVRIVNKDKVFKQYFPHKTIPHYVLIDSSGSVRLITSEATMLFPAIDSLMYGKRVAEYTKPQLIKYNGQKPLFTGGQADDGNEVLYHSIFTGYRPQFPGGAARGKNYITCMNMSLKWLAQLAYGKFDMQYLDRNRLILEGFKTKEDSLDIGAFQQNESAINEWKKIRNKHLYTYELSFPDSICSNEQLFEMMQQDLNRFIYGKGIRMHMEQKPSKVLGLSYVKGKSSPAFKQVSEKPVHYSAAGTIKMVNQPLEFFLSQLVPVTQGEKLSLVNNTGYSGLITLDLSKTGSIKELNESLFEYNLVLKEIEKPLDIIIITKTK